MTLKLIVKKLQLSSEKFTTGEELKDDCRALSLDYLTTIKYLLRNKYLGRTFRGIFYVYSINERKLGVRDISFYELIKEAMKRKGIGRWYFGLETALKMNNLTHEYFTIDSIMSSMLFRAKPITILGRKVKFFKLSYKLISFGIKYSKIPYSDPEKTALDMLHLKHYSKSEFLELSGKLSKIKLKKYAKQYNNRVKEIVNETP